MAERKTIKKWFWVWEFEKEEIWLNAMAQSGWLLDGLGFCKYHFVACEPGTYNIRLEMREHDEEYLDAMAQSGWLLEGLGFAKYHFVACEPGTYNIRLEMREHDEEYLDFMAQTGAEYVGRMAKWIYFRKKVEDGPFDLFSDLDSRVRHLDKIGKMLTGITLANFAIGVGNSISALPFAWVNLLCASLLTYCLSRIHEKKDALEQNRLLME